MKKETKDRSNKIIAFFTGDSTTDTFKDVKTEDGRVMRVSGDTITVDATIQEVTEDGLVAIEDGDYSFTDDAIKATVVDGVITAVEDIKTEDTSTEDTSTEGDDTTAAMKKTFKAVAKFGYDTAKFATIKEISKWDMTVDQEDFEIGTVVTTTWEYDGETETYTAYSGTYELEDGRMITLNDEGVVILIADATGTVIAAPAVGDNINGGKADTTTEDTTTEDSAADETMSKVLDAFESLNEKYKALTTEFEAFKAAPSVPHTNQKIDMKAETNTQPKSYLHALLK